MNFPWGYDMNQALLRVDAAFAQKLPSLPQGTSYDIIQMSPNVIMPFVSYALISEERLAVGSASAGAIPDRAAAHGHRGRETRGRARRPDAGGAGLGRSRIGCAPMA